MGKTADGAVWLNANMLTPYEYWQYWRNAEDGDVGRFLRIFTDLPQGEIVRLEMLKGSELNEAKKTLATEATALLHGRTAASEAAETARKTFEEGVLSEGLPTVEIARSKLAAGISVASLAHAAGLASSSSEARRQIEGGGLRVNDKVVDNVKATVREADLQDGGVLKLSIGRKKHALVKVV